VARSDRHITKLLAVVAVLATTACGLGGCAKRPLYGMSIDSEAFAGAGTLGLSVRGRVVIGLVVYFHGSDQTASVIRDDRKHTDFFDPILRAGYAVVAADAHGNAFGDPASQEDYRRLVASAAQKYVAKPMFFVAESMGALPALTLLAQDAQRQVTGLVGINPLMGLPPEVRAVSYVAGPWGGQIPADADPLNWPPKVFAGRSFQLFTADDDKVIPASASAQAFADRFATVAAITVVNCAGGHVAADCYRGADVERWMTARR
jgi:hypothetical protein